MRSLRSWLWRIPIDQEIDEELALHVEMRTRELIHRGVDPRRARELATFVSVTLVLAFIAALSIVGPARRAARIDPADALRSS